MQPSADELFAKVDFVAFDFDGVFTDNTVFVDQNGVESVRCWRSDGLGLAKLPSVGVRAVIVSTERNPVVSARARKLNLMCEQGVDDKAAAILRLCETMGVSPERTMFVGNDINDIPAFRSVGVPIAVADAHPDVIPHVLFMTRTPGGYGAVREVCDQIVAAKQQARGARDHDA